MVLWGNRTFIFLDSIFLLSLGSSRTLLERYNRLVCCRPSFSEVYLVVWSLYVLLVRLLSLPPFYHRIVIIDLYLGYQLIFRSSFGALDMCHSSFNSSSRSEEEHFGSEKEPMFLGSSESLEYRPRPSSVTPFERNSQGRALELVSSGESSQASV